MLKILLIGLICFNSFASVGKIEESIYVRNTSKWFLDLLSANPHITIDHPSEKGVEVYGPKGTRKWLKDIGVEVDEVYFNLKYLDKSFANYPSYNEIKNKLISLNKKFPKITKLFSIGKSVEGRDLLVMKISDNPQLDEVEPEFKFISSMHGDEITGRELTINFIQDLLESYAIDSKVANLINNTEIFIMPSMNPDGSEKRQRANANGFDLNRNFPNWDSNLNDLLGRQPETIAVMKFQSERQFSLSANFHGGSVCVNYPWDSTKVRHPFDELLKSLSLAYSMHNFPMYHSRSFEQGITNGADWYVVKGGMQDWSYVFFNDLQVTVELSDEKWPKYSEIESFYLDNKESMLSYLELIHQGAGFKLSKKIDGTVSISKNDGDKVKDLGTYDFRSGEFYKVLETGNYTFKVQSANTLNTKFEVEVDSKIRNNGNYVNL